MKTYIVRVNGKSYEVEVEEVNSCAATESAAAAPPGDTRRAAPPVQPASTARTASKPILAGSAECCVAAPMTGTVLRLHVRPGDTVRGGSVLLILEAMKMENEIFAPVDGRVAAVHVSAGDSVSAGTALVHLE